MSDNIKKNPLISIQCDWDSSLRQKGGSAWISYKYIGQRSSESIITNVSSANKMFEVTPSDFDIGNVAIATIRATHLASGYTTSFKAADYVYNNIHKHSIQSLDVTNQGLAVSACTDGKLYVWDTRAAAIKHVLTGHKGDVYKCRFFPSGIVVLSAGADMSLKIWCANTGVCPVTLRGHTAAVTDFSVVDRGMNIISVSKDGTAKLWSCGKARCLATLIQLKTQINCCTLSVSSSICDLGGPKDTPVEDEVGTEDKILIIGCEDGTVFTIGVLSRKKLLSVYCSSAVNAVASDDKLFVVGCQDGSTKVYNISKSQCIKSFTESSSATLCIFLYKDVGVFAGKTDGTCIFYTNLCGGNSTLHDLQLTGSHYDPIYDIAADETGVYTACRDGKIRKYVMPQQFKQIIERPVD